MKDNIRHNLLKSMMSLVSLPKRKKNKKIKRFVFRFLSFTFIFLLIAQLTLLYFANPLLKSLIKEKIQIATKGVFTVDFDKVSINLHKRSISLNDFKLTPNQENYNKLKKAGKADKALYAFNFSLLSFKGFEIWKFYKTKKLSVKKILLDKPIVRLIDLPQKKISSKTEKYDAVHKDLYPSIKGLFNSLEVKNVEVKEGHFDFFIRKNKQQMSSIANKVSVRLTDFYLDEDAYKKRDRVFYSENIEMEVKGYVIKLQDSTHVLRAKKTFISTKKSYISVKDVSIKAEQLKQIEKKKIKKEYIDANIPEIKIEGIDVANIFFNKKLDVKTMVFMSPNIEVHNSKKRKKENRESKIKKQEIDLYSLINKKFSRLQVNNFALQNAQIKLWRNEKTKNKTYTSIDSLSLILDDFLVDENSYQRKDRLFYAQNINFMILGYEQLNEKKRNRIKADKIFLSTKDELLFADNISIEPINKNSEKKFTLNISKIQLNGLNLFDLYNGKGLPIRKMSMYKPDLKLKLKNKGKKKKKKNKIAVIMSIAQNLLPGIKINYFEIEKGRFEIEETIKGTKIYGDISLNMTDLKVKTDKNIKKNIYAESANITVENYIMNLKNNSKELLIDSINISTTDKTLFLKNLKFGLPENVSVIRKLKQNKKKSYININIDNIIINKFNILKALLKNKIDADSIEIRNPLVALTSYPELNEIYENDSSEIIEIPDTISKEVAKIIINPTAKIQEATNKKDIKQLFANLFDTLSLNKTNIKGGELKFTTKKQNGQKKLSLNGKFDAEIENLAFNPKDEKNDNIFLSDDIKLHLTDYNVSFTDKVYGIEVGNIEISSKQKNIKLFDVNIMPDKRRANKIKLPLIYEIKFPKMELSNINWDKALKTREFNIDKLKLCEAKINVVNRVKFKKKKTKKKSKKNKKPKFKALNINNIIFSKGKLGLIKEIESVRHLFSETGFSMDINNFRIDSSEFARKEGIPFAEALIFNLKDYSLKMPDSLHILKAAELTVSTGKSQIYAKNLSFKYDSLKRNKILQKDSINAKFFDFNIDKFKIDGLNFDQIYTEHKADIKTISLEGAKINVEMFKKGISGAKNKKKLISSNINLYPAISSKLKKFSVEQLNLKDANLNIDSKKEKKNRKFGLNNIGAVISDLLIDSLSYLDTTRFYYAKNINFTVNDFKKNSADSLYYMSFDKMHLNLKDSTVAIKNFRRATRYNFEKTANKYGYQKSISNLNFGKISLNGLDFKNMLSTKKIRGRNINIDSVSAHFYKDKRLPKKVIKQKPIIQTVILKPKANYKFDSLYLDNMFINYEERNEGTEEPAKINIDDLSIDLSNLTNDSLSISRNKITKADVSCNLMSQGKLETTILIDLNAADSAYSYYGNLSNMDLRLFNDYLENSVFVKIEDGYVENLNFSVEANDSISEGDLKFRYKDLKIRLLSKKGKYGVFKKLGTFFANLILKNNNPDRKNKLRIGRIYSEHNPTKSFVGQIIKALLSGAKSTMGFEPREARQKRKEDNAIAKKERKKAQKISKNAKKWAKIQRHERTQRIYKASRWLTKHNRIRNKELKQKQKARKHLKKKQKELENL